MLAIRRVNTAKAVISVLPNPASGYITVSFNSLEKSEATIRIIDNVGKTIMQQKQKVTAGINTVQLTNLTKCNSGVYMLQVLVNRQILTHKIILSR